jgi:hypothetical protein
MTTHGEQLDALERELKDKQREISKLNYQIHKIKEEAKRCAWCPRKNWDDGLVLIPVKVIVNWGEEFEALEERDFCEEHLSEVILKLQGLGFSNNNEREDFLTIGQGV